MDFQKRIWAGWYSLMKFFRTRTVIITTWPSAMDRRNKKGDLGGYSFVLRFVT